jgi:hypothetical protein
MISDPKYTKVIHNEHHLPVEDEGVQRGEGAGQELQFHDEILLHYLHTISRIENVPTNRR